MFPGDGGALAGDISGGGNALASSLEGLAIYPEGISGTLSDSYTERKKNQRKGLISSKEAYKLLFDAGVESVKVWASLLNLNRYKVA
jgi:hypothetical protein